MMMQLLARAGIPHVHFGGPRVRGYKPPVATDGRVTRAEFLNAHVEGQLFRGACRVPRLGEAVGPWRAELLAVRAGRQREDAPRAVADFVTEVGGELPPGLDVPERYSAALAHGE